VRRFARLGPDLTDAVACMAGGRAVRRIDLTTRCSAAVRLDCDLRLCGYGGLRLSFAASGAGGGS